MATEQKTTGVSNEYYNLVSILYHSLQSAQTSNEYIQDAEKAGNKQLIQFLKQVQQEDSQRAEKAKQLLMQMK